MHQITTLVSETEGLAHLKSTRKIYEQRGVDAAVEAYLNAMGVGDPVMTLMRKTWAASIRWLGPAELKASQLATLALDPAEPILASGANGLNAKAFDGDPPRADLIEASFAQPVAGSDETIEIAFRYRRGGGAVEAETNERGLKPPEAPFVSGPELGLERARRRSRPAADHWKDSGARAHRARALLRARSRRRDHCGRGAQQAGGLRPGRACRDGWRESAHRRSLSLNAEPCV